MLEVRGLTVTYGATQSVRAIDLTVRDSQVTALLGANGAGKTSTLRAISRLIPAQGSIVFDGQDVTGVVPEELARLGLIHVPEGRHVFGSLSVLDNLQVGETARSGRERMFSVPDIMDLFPALVPLRRRQGWSLSGGEQQMVAIGRALMSAPRLLMLDEPSLGLAPVMVKAVYRALRETRGLMATLLVEQNTSVALELADVAYVLQSGTIALEFPAAEFSDRTALLESYLGHRGEEPAHESP